MRGTGAEARAPTTPAVIIDGVLERLGPALVTAAWICLWCICARESLPARRFGLVQPRFPRFGRFALSVQYDLVSTTWICARFLSSCSRSVRLGALSFPAAARPNPISCSRSPFGAPVAMLTGYEEAYPGFHWQCGIKQSPIYFLKISFPIKSDLFAFSYVQSSLPG